MGRSRILKERQSFLGYDQHCQENIRELKTLLAPAIDDLLDDFYHFMRERPETRDLLPTQEVLMRARNAQKQHWLDLLFSDALGNEYCERAIQAGQTHERIGLTLSAYLGGYCHVLNGFADLATAKYHGDTHALIDKLKSLHKAVFLDIDFVTESYLEAKNSAIRKILQNTTRFIAEIEEIDRELAGLRQSLEPRGQAMAENLQNCRERLDRLRKLLPPSEENLALSEQMGLLQGAFADCEEDGRVIAEQFKPLSQHLNRLKGEVAVRKNSLRMNPDAGPQPGFLTRLKNAVQVLFP